MARGSSFSVARAARVLAGGGLVLHATEGVWGLACDPFSARAVGKLLTLKQRRADKGLIVIGADSETFAPELATVSAAQRAEVLASWPGPVTWLLPNVRFPRWITGSSTQVAARVPGHAQARNLCRAFGGPLVSTSANLSGRPPARRELPARAALARGGVDFVLPGATAGHVGPSEIRTLDGERLRG